MGYCFSVNRNSSHKAKKWNLGLVAPHTFEIFFDLMLPSGGDLKRVSVFS